MPSKELNILIIACRLYLDTSKIEDWKIVVDDTSLDWKRAFDLAAWHNIRPIFFEALRQYKPDTVPSELLQNLTSFCRQLTVGTLSKLVQLKELTENFERENIQLVLHKGIHYASFYKNLGHREFGDIDVFVKKTDLKKAIQLMLDLGYKSYIEYENIASVEAEELMKFDHHLQFTHHEGKAFVEVHWKSHVHEVDFSLGYENIKINSLNLTVPSEETVAILMTAHHGKVENWERIKYLLDLAIFTKKENVNWSEVSPKLDKLGFTSSFQTGKSYIDNLFFDEYPTYSKSSEWFETAENILGSDEAFKIQHRRLHEPFINKIFRLYSKLKLLSAETQLNLFKAAIIIAIIKIGLKVLPYPTFKKLYDRGIQSDFQEEYPQTKLSKAAWAIKVVSARWPWNATCLPQALSFKYFFRKDPSLHLKIGVNKTNQGIFQAHAWVEKEGKVLIGETPETFVPLWEWNQ